jgi:energy-coupling factor transporter ATP-binding protein EcfA2
MATTKKKPSLRAVRIQVRDVLGAREFSIAPGKINLISGANGTGKSSALKAVETALGGGNLSRLARIDPDGKETEPEVVLVLAADDGSEAYRIEKKGDKLRVKSRVGDTPGFEDVAKPQAWLKGLYDARGSNPVEFLTAKADDRATLLLEAIPLDYSRAKLLEAVGVEVDLSVPPGMLHPLQDIALVRDAIFTRRTGVNRDSKTKAAAALEVLQAAPASTPEGLAERAAELQATVEDEAAKLAKWEADSVAEHDAAVTKAKTAHQRDVAALSGGASDAVQKLKADHAEKARELRAAAEARIEEDRLQIETAVDAVRTRQGEALAAARAELEAATTAADAAMGKAVGGLTERRNAIAQLRVELARAQEQAKAAAKAAGLIEQAARFNEEAKGLDAEAEALTQALDALDVFRRDLGKGIPIPGLEIDGKEIRVNGLPFDMLNTAQRVDLAVRVAVLRSKGSRLPLLFVDGAEALDAQSLEALIDRLGSENIQAFLAMVESGSPLKVETRGLFDEAEA